MSISSIHHRVWQGLVALRPRVPSNRDDILAAWLTPAQAAAFRRLPSHDQAHLLRVYHTLSMRGVTDSDVLVAGLLHDIGKTSGEGRVRLIDRAAKVLLARAAPGVLAQVGAADGPRWRRGLYLAVHHAQLGAERAAMLGCSPRTCWLIAHHEDHRSVNDPELDLLMCVDQQTP